LLSLAALVVVVLLPHFSLTNAQKATVCHSERSEESAVVRKSGTVRQMQILRFAQDDRLGGSTCLFVPRKTEKVRRSG